MTKILMVCLGNICRSPLAEGIMKKMVKERGLDIEVDSAGTNGYHDGESPDKRSQKVARKNGIDISEQVSRQVNQEDFERFDIIFAMDRSNFSTLKSWADNQYHDKIQLIMNYSPIDIEEVPDPYYGGEKGFVDVYDMLSEACEGFLIDVIS